MLTKKSGQINIVPLHFIPANLGKYILVNCWEALKWSWLVRRFQNGGWGFRTEPGRWPTLKDAGIGINKV